MARSFEVASIYTAVDRFSNPLGKMSIASNRFSRNVQGSTARASRALDTLNKPINGIAAGFKNLAGLAGGFVIGAGLLNAANVVIEFEQASVDLGAILGKNRAQMKGLDDNAKLLGATTSFTATEVLKLEEAYARLGFKTPDIIALTAGTIDGAVALGATADEAAGLAGALVNTFDKFNTKDTAEIFDKLTLATQNSALNFEKLQVALPIVGGAANAAGVPFDTLVALLGKLSDAGIDTSSSATALRNIFIDSASEGKDFSQILESISKNQDKLTAANDAFGKKTAVSATVLANSIAKTKELNIIISSATAGQEKSGIASDVAAQKLDTLQGRLTLLSSAYQGFVLSTDDGSGGLSRFAKNTVEVITEMLSLASGTATAVDALTAHELKVRSVAGSLVFLVKWAAISFIVIKTLTAGIWLWRKAVIAFQIAQGVANFIQGGSLIALRANQVAMATQVVLTNAVTAAQWLWNAALTANPIGIIIVAVAALAAGIGFLIAGWDEWGQVANAALFFISTPLAVIISAVMTFRQQWAMITKAFSEGGILAGLRAIGITIFDMILSPVQQLLELLAKIPGLEGIAFDAAADIKQFRADLGLDVGPADFIGPVAPTDVEAAVSPVAAINPNVTQVQGQVIREESLQKQNVQIDISDSTGLASISSDNDFIPISLTSTLAF